MRYVFIHIPKTGGTYAQKVLNTLNDNIIDVGHQWYNDIECEGWGSWAKDTTHKLHEKIVLTGYSNTLQKDDYVFTVIRNPFDLLCSYYFHGDNSFHNGWANCNNIHQIKSFEHFVNLYCDDTTNWHFPVLKENIFSQLYNGDDVVVDEVIKFENLSKNISDFAEIHNLRVSPDLNTKQNQSNRRDSDFRKHYNNNMVDLLNIKMVEVLKRFNYRFE